MIRELGAKNATTRTGGDLLGKEIDFQRFPRETAPGGLNDKRFGMENMSKRWREMKRVGRDSSAS